MTENYYSKNSPPVCREVMRWFPWLTEHAVVRCPNYIMASKYKYVLRLSF